MGLDKHGSEMFVERRGVIGAFQHWLRRGRDRLRAARRGRRTYKQRFSRLACLLVAIFLFCVVAFGLNMFLHGKMEGRASSTHAVKVADTLKEADTVKEANSVQEASIVSGVGKKPTTKHRKRHLPCEITLSDSVNNLVEPSSFMNFTQLSLHYIEKEENSIPRFGGHQTLGEREKSFHARSQKLHCGFVKGPARFPSTGFDLDEKDKLYMNTCKVVVSSCIFGSSDFLRRPTSKRITEYSKKNVCFVMFVDEETLSTLSSEGNIPDDRGHIGLWKIVVVKNLPYKDMRRTGKVPKLLSHRLFPSSRYSIWLDSKMRLNTDPMLIIEYVLWRTKSEFAISNHYDRHCVWEEVLQNKRLNKYNHTAIDEQFLFYQSDGLTKFDPADPNTPLPSYVPEGSFIVRAHTPMSNLFSCLWFNEVDRFTSRDQLSFAYTYLKLRRLNPDRQFHLHMFKDCERRAIAKLFHHRELPVPASP
ncbi:uncharacterized protein J3R85_007239 [Psidium guajava]|nr:uncharacterized protein J3R85_007239 [Psidium guajava]